MKLTQPARTAAIALAFGLSMVITAAPALACSGRGDHFLAALESHGIEADPDTAFELAEAICSGLADGETYQALIDQGVTDTVLTAKDFAYVVEQSVVFFCPESAALIPH